MIRFHSGALYWEFSNPVLSNEYKYNVNVTYGRSAGGQLYRYAKGVTVKTIKMKWENVRQDEKEQFQACFASISTDDFTYTDHQSQAWNARFITPEINFTEINDEQDSLSSNKIGNNYYRSTQRKAGRWTYEAELEIWE